MTLPSADRQFAWIEHVVAEGIRRPGSPADQRVEAWCRDQFEALGLEDVHLEPVELPVWEDRSATLTIGGTVLEGLALPHTRPTEGLEADLAPLVEGGDHTGQIVVDHVRLSDLPQALLATMATSTYDPDGEFDHLVQTLPFGPRFQEVAEPAIAAGAVGYVGILDAPWDTCDYYVPYDGIDRPISALWLSGSDGEQVDGFLHAGVTRATIAVDATRTTGVSHNVVGTLPGASDEWVIIASHHDAPWASAVEDGSGIAMVLAQAEHWASVPAAERPHNLLFLLTAGHMVAGAGTAAFIEQHSDFLAEVVLEIHLEHTANETRGDGDGGLEVTGEPEVRWWFTSREPGLEAAVADALAAHDLRRSFVLPPDVFGPHPTTDGGYFHTAGVPLVNFLTAPMYLFDAADTLDKIHRPSLEPVGQATIRIVESLAGRTAAELRRRK